VLVFLETSNPSLVDGDNVHGGEDSGGLYALRNLSRVSFFHVATSIPAFCLAFDMEEGLP